METMISMHETSHTALQQEGHSVNQMSKYSNITNNYISNTKHVLIYHNSPEI